MSGALTGFCSITKWKTNNGPATTFSFSEHSQVASAGHLFVPGAPHDRGITGAWDRSAFIFN